MNKTLTQKHKQGFRALLCVAIVTGSAGAHAAVPTEASDAVTALVTDSAAFVAQFWPLAIAVTVGFVFFKLFKKGIGKAT